MPETGGIRIPKGNPDQSEIVLILVARESTTKRARSLAVVYYSHSRGMN